MYELTAQEASILATWKTRPCVVITMPGRFEDAPPNASDDGDRFFTLCNFDLDDPDNSDDVILTLKTIIVELEDRKGKF